MKTVPVYVGEEGVARVKRAQGLHHDGRTENWFLLLSPRPTKIAHKKISLVFFQM